MSLLVLQRSHDQIVLLCVTTFHALILPFLVQVGVEVVARAALHLRADLRVLRTRLTHRAILRIAPGVKLALRCCNMKKVVGETLV